MSPRACASCGIVVPNASLEYLTGTDICFCPWCSEWASDYAKLRASQGLSEQQIIEEISLRYPPGATKRGTVERPAAKVKA